MKKTILILMFSFLLVSCSNEKLNESVSGNEAETEQGYIELLEDINTYNLDFGIPNDTETKGKIWKAIVKFFLSDAGGCIFGAALGAGAGPAVSLGAGLLFGIFGSILNVSGISINSMDYTPTSPESGVLSAYEIPYNLYDSVGIYHNMIITEIYNEDGENLSEYAHGEKRDIVLNMVEEKLQMNLNFTNEDYIEFENFHHNMSVCMENESFDDLLLFYKNMYPDYSREFDIIFEYFESLFTVHASLKHEYYDGFRELVLHSVIPQDSKNFISMVISVATNSMMLWRVDYE